MSEHNLILEFYKPTYNLDFDYDGDGGLDLHFTSIKGEFFMTMENSYDGIYFDDVDCTFFKGEMFASVDLGDLVERIVQGEFRQTNGKAVSDWGKRFLGDGEEQIEFNGKNYADGSLFWDDFFKEMPKNEIKDFMTFCEDYLYLPNIEVDTVSNKWDFENGKVELKSNDKWGIGISDDYNIISVDEFTCDSEDAFVAYDVASSESDEDGFYESKKSAKRSLKEGISAFNKAIAKKYNDTEPNGAGQYYLDWRFDLHDEKDNIEAIADRCGVIVEFQSDEGYFEVFEESKKSVRKSLKEEAMTTKLFRFIQDLYDVHYITEEQLNKFQQHNFSKKEIKVLEQNYEIYKTSNEFDEINNAIKLTVNMINSFKESLKESTDESFSLYDLNKHDPFVKEWIRNINKELRDVSIESIGDDEIVFRVWFDENIDLDIFDDIATDCMPSLLIEFMSDMNIDFNYQFVYEDDKFTENDFVFIRFVAW